MLLTILSVWPPVERHIKNVLPIHGELRSVVQTHLLEAALPQAGTRQQGILMLTAVQMNQQVTVAILTQHAKNARQHTELL